MASRYEPDVVATARALPGGHIELLPNNAAADWFCSMLGEGIRCLRDVASRKPAVLTCYMQMMSRLERGDSPLNLHLSRTLPTVATLEASATGEPGGARIVLNRGTLLALHDALGVADLTPEERLALMWPVLSRILGLIAFPLDTRDLYAAKVEVVARLAYIAVNVLYESVQDGELTATACGEAVERVLAHTVGQSRKEARQKDAYLRLLLRLGFVLRAKPYETYAEELRIAARGYLDTLYIRLSLSGAMPDLEPWRQAMSLDLTGGRPRPSAPRVGSYGVASAEDLAEWREVAKPLREQGFILLRQLGVGEFGRVYEAHNLANSLYPQHVAIKVDRILGKKKRAILEAEAAMQVGRDLANANHLIRIYDTGKIHGLRFTYHVLQLVDGETIDELVGALEVEHVSIPGPPMRRSTLAEWRRELAQRLGLARTQTRPIRTGAGPFRFGLSPAMLMDLVTGMLMCLEEVHELGYAMNDLKNDNLMLSRRGQLKGIDLDSFSKVASPLDKCTDFMFLATSLSLVVLHAASPGDGKDASNWHELLGDEKRLRRAIAGVLPRVMVEHLAEGRVSQEEIVDILTTLVLRSKSLHYAMDPTSFSRDISCLVAVKRRLLQEDLVID